MLSEAKGHGEIPSVIHGSPIGKPYPSSVATRKWEQRLKPLGVGAFQRGERPTKIGYSWFSVKSISVERMMSMARGRALNGLGWPISPYQPQGNSEYRPRSFVQTDFLGAKIQSREENSPDRTLRAQVIHRSDETLKAAFSSVSSGTFCQSGKVFSDNTWRYQKVIWHLDIDSSHPGVEEGPKGSVVHRFKCSAGQLSWYGRTAAPREILLYISSRTRFLNRTSIGERCQLHSSNLYKGLSPPLTKRWFYPGQATKAGDLGGNSEKKRRGRSGVEEWSTHQAHDLKTAGSNPVPA
ncbi:hypothetical protein AgCh_016010 [Apium graveolens]